MPLVCLMHPRNRTKISKQTIKESNKHIHYVDPLGFFDFVNLEKHAACVLTDSGTVQEECCIFRIPSVTLSDTKERPETIEAGSNIHSGADPDAILRCLDFILDGSNDG